MKKLMLFLLLISFIACNKEDVVSENFIKISASDPKDGSSVKPADFVFLSIEYNILQNELEMDGFYAVIQFRQDESLQLFTESYKKLQQRSGKFGHEFLVLSINPMFEPKHDLFFRVKLYRDDSGSFSSLATSEEIHFTIAN